MGKPLSKPDCLGEHRVGSCLSKKEDDDDGYIEDCYVPQRSIYDTVRINEQIDCGSSASLLSRQLAERLLLPVSQRSLEQPTGTISSNGSLGTNAITVSAASGSASSREIRRLDEKAIFDALKLSGPIGGCPETAAAMRPQMSCSSERRDNCQRRSWKVFSPREIMEVDAYITAELGKFNSTPKPRASAPELPFCTKDTDGPADELAESMPKYNEESQGCGVGNELHEQVMRTFCGSGSSLDVYSDNVYDEVFSTEAEGGELKMGIDKTVQVKSECILSDDSETIHHQTENCSCDMETAACMHACINGEFSFLPLEEGAIDTGCQEDVQDNSTPAGEENFQPEHKVVLELRKELEETEKIFPAVVELGTLIITDSVSPKTNCLTVTQNVESSDSKCAEEDPRLEFGLFLSGNECAVERLQIENNGKSQKWEQKDEGSLEVHVDNLTEQREVEEEFVFVEHTTSCGEIEDSLTVNVDNMGPEELDIDSFLDSRLPSESYISSDHASSSAEVSSITDGPSDLADDSMTDTEPSDIGFNDYTITDFTSTRFGHEALELDLLGGYESCPDDLEVLDTEALLQEAPDIMPGHDQLLTDVTTEGDSFENDKKVLAFQKGKVEALQTAVQAVNWQGQALVQSAPPTADTHNLETSLEDVNTRWNSLNRQVAERAAKLQEALLHCGKFYEALESLLSWLADTEELVAGQKPPSAEYKVVRAQLQEQKLLQRVLEGNRVRVEALRSEGELIAEQTSEPVERQRVLGALESLDHRWQALIDKADARRRQLEAILTLAKQFHDTLQPLSDWMVGLERRLAMVEPVDTRSPVIQEQIKQLKALQEEIAKQAGSLERAQGFAGSLLSLTSLQAGAQAQTNLETFRARYLEMSNRVARRAVLLEIALDNAQIFGRDEVALLTWLAELREALSLATVEDYQTAVLQGQFHQQMALQEEITSRKPDVDQAVKKGQALLKQSTGDDTLLVQEKLEGLRAQYVELVATSNHATRSLEEALQLATHFEAAHGELDDALGSLEAGLYDYDEAEACGVEPTSLLQNRQQALRQGVMDGHVLLDTVNEVGRALLQLVPWRARERLDQQMAEAGERFRAVRYAVEQRAERVDAAIQRSQQFEQAVLAERAWAAEMSRKLDTLGEISLEQDQMSSQLRVQKAFTLDVLRHKETMEELVVNAPNVLASCNDEEKDRQQSQLEVLNQEFDSVNRSNSERQQRLERAQGLLGQFWESYEELCPWLDETETTLAILPAPAMEPDALRLQQDELRLLRESVAEHKPHIDRLAKTGPMLAELSAREGLVLADQATNVRQRYMAFRTEMQHRAIALDEAEELATQFHDKINPMIESLERVVERLREPPPTPAEVEKIRDQILETCAVTAELEKLQPSFMALRSRGEEIVARSEHTTSSDNSAARAVQKCLDHLAFLWSDIEARAEEREAHLLDVLDVAERFWPDLTALLTTLRDTFDCIRDLDEPGLDPSVIKQQTEVTQSFREEIDTLLDELETLRATGGDLMSACGEPDKPDVKKSIDEVNVLWDLLNKAWQDRMEHLEEAMQTTIQFQDMLQNIFDWLDSSEAQLVAMSPVGTELNTVKEQMVELKAFKEETYQQQIEMEKLSHQGEVLHRKAEGTANRDMLEAPLRELRRQWAVLDSKIITRQHKLESSLLALGQFQHALEELLSWLSHTEDLLAEQKPIREDPKEIEIELAKHHVLRNDVLAHKATLENVAQAGGELVQLGDGDVAGSVLRQKLNRLQKRWEDLLKETELRQKKLESALNQAQGFQGEIHALLAWLGKVEAQLLLSRPFGGLPETSRDQLNAHLELCADLDKREPTYLSLMERGVDVLSAGKTSSSTNTAQVLHSLEQRWQNVCAKAAERRVRNVRLAFVSFCVSEWYCCYNRTVG
uniref:Uncharacterized protein n=1 Tax=Eptatretus burgeri TaxID=7764 RepID=A0A8C4R8G0_EPTBU